MSAPAIALTVIAAIAYLVIGFTACGLIGFLFMDGELFGRRWTVGCLGLLAIPLWPVMLALWIPLAVIGAVMEW